MDVEKHYIPRERVEAEAEDQTTGEAERLGDNPVTGKLEYRRMAEVDGTESSTVRACGDTHSVGNIL